MSIHLGLIRGVGGALVGRWNRAVETSGRRRREGRRRRRRELDLLWLLRYVPLALRRAWRDALDVTRRLERAVDSTELRADGLDGKRRRQRRRRRGRRRRRAFCREVAPRDAVDSITRNDQALHARAGVGRAGRRERGGRACAHPPSERSAARARPARGAPRTARVPLVARAALVARSAAPPSRLPNEECGSASLARAIGAARLPRGQRLGSASTFLETMVRPCHR